MSSHKVRETFTSEMGLGLAVVGLSLLFWGSYTAMILVGEIGPMLSGK